MLVQSLKMHMKYVLYNKFRMIIFHDQEVLTLNFKSSCLQMFFKIDVLKNLAMLTGKHLCWSYFLTKLQGWRTAIALKRDSNISAFLWILQRNLFWRTSANGYVCTSNRKVTKHILVICRSNLFLTKNITWNGFYYEGL